MKKRIFSLFLALTMILGVIAPVNAAGVAAPNKTNDKQEREFEKEEKDGYVSFTLTKDDLNIDDLNIDEEKDFKTGNSPFIRFMVVPQPTGEQTIDISITVKGKGIDGAAFPWNDIAKISQNGFEVELYKKDPETKEETKLDINIEKITKAGKLTVKVPKNVLANNGQLKLKVKAYKNIHVTLTDSVGTLANNNFNLTFIQLYNNKVDVKWEDENNKKINAPTELDDNIKGKVKWGDDGEELAFELKGLKEFPDDDDYYNRVKSLKINLDKILTVGNDKYNTKLEQDAITGTAITLTKMATVIVPDDPKDPTPTGYGKVEFSQGENGVFEANAKTVFFVLTGKTIAEAKAATPALVIPKVTANEGYQHKGWTDGTKDGNKDKVFKEDLADYTKTIDESGVTFTALNKKEVADTDPQDNDYVKLTFDANGGKVKLGQNAEADSLDRWILKSATFDKAKAGVTATKQGTTFSDWQDKSTNGTVVADTQKFNADTTVYANYTAKAPVVDVDPQDNDYVKLTFNANGGKVKLGQNAEANSLDRWILKSATFDKAKAGVTATKQGATFSDWQDKSTNGTVVADTQKFNADTTVYANYTAKAPVVDTDPQDNDYVKLTFDANGGKVKLDSAAGDGAESLDRWVLKTTSFLTAKNGVVATKDGSEFKEWDNAAQNGVKVGDNENFTTDSTVYAIYRDEIIGPVDPGKEQNPDADKYFSVTFKSADETKGTVAAENTFYVLKTANKTLKDLKDKAPETTPAQGYRFEKWNPALDEKTAIDSNKEVVATFIELETSNKPTITQPVEGDTTISGKGEPGAKIEVELPDGTKKETEVDNDGNWKVDVPADKPLNKDDKITATQTEDGKNPASSEATVIGKKEDISKTPIINQPVEGDTTISGKGEPGAKIEIELPDGTKIETEVDNDGNWKVDVPAEKPLDKGDKITATQTEDGKKPASTEATVAGKDEPKDENIDDGGGIEFSFFNFKKKAEKKNTLHYIFTIGKYEYKEVRNGVETEYKMDVAPVIENERTMLPLRYVAEAIGAEVMWNENTRTATFTKNGLTATIQIDGNKIVLSDGRVVEMDAKPMNINSRILVSVVNVGNVFELTNGNVLDKMDQDIEWNGAERTATIYVQR